MYLLFVKYTFLLTIFIQAINISTYISIKFKTINIPAGIKTSAKNYFILITFR